ncbi:MAG: hypothetical protein MOGMAGMI_01769 [Candidatus Omnitrophica bacterium]|nr:hypothetical protein [Candidatus Omnitrophota bacterium]
MRKRCSLRYLATVLLVCFVLQDLSYAQGGSASWPTYKTAPRSERRDAESLRKPQVPRHLGTTRGAYLNGSDRTLIHIEDAHESLDAQEKIVSILEVLASDYDIRTVALEGGSTAFDGALFKSFPDPAGARRAARKLLENGRLNAGEFFAATSGGALDVYGAEDETLYRANLKTFRDLLDNRDRYENALSGVDKTLSLLAERVYGEDARAVRNLRSQTGERGPGFTARWTALKAVAARRGFDQGGFAQLERLDAVTGMEKHIDFAAANDQRERLLEAFRALLSGQELEQVLLRSLSYKAGRTTEADFHLFLTDLAHRYRLDPASYPDLARYTEYLVLFETIDLPGLLGEMARYEDALLEACMSGEDDARLLRVERVWSRISSMLRGIATYEEVRDLAATGMRASIDSFALDLTELAERHRVPMFGGGPPRDLRRALAVASRFYRLAEKRNDALVANTLGRMKSTDTRAAALVTGGYHSPGISRLLRERRLSHLVILPRITDPNKKRPYMVILTRRPAAYERQLSSETGRYQIAIRSVFTAGRNNPLATDAELAEVLGPFVTELKARGDLARAVEEWMNAYAVEYAARQEANQALRPERLRRILGQMTGLATLTTPEAPSRTEVPSARPDREPVTSGARLSVAPVLRVTINGSALEVPARGILTYSPSEPLNYRQLLHLVARSPIVTGYSSGLAIEADDVYIERDEPVRGGEPGETRTEIYALTKSTEVRVKSKTVDVGGQEVALNERSAFMEVRDGDIVTIEARKGRKPRVRAVDLSAYDRFEIVERAGVYVVREKPAGARLAVSELTQRGGRLHAVHLRLRDEMLVPYLTGAGVAVSDAEVVANTLVRARQGLLDYYRDTGLLTAEEAVVIGEAFATKTLEDGGMVLDRLQRLSLNDGALAGRIRERLDGYAGHPAAQRADLVERLVPIEDVRARIADGVPEWVVWAALRNRLNLFIGMDDAVEFVRTHQERTGGPAIAWQYVLFYGLEEGERLFDQAAAWVADHAELMGGTVNAWKFLLAHNLETADRVLEASRVWVEAHQGRVGGPANAWQIVLSYGVKGAGAFLKKAERWVASHGAQVGGPANAWRIYTRQGAQGADAFVTNGRAWVDANQTAVRGRRNAWSILAAHGLSGADAVVTAGTAWVSAHHAEVGGRRNAWDIFIKQGASSVATWVEAHRDSANDRMDAGASPARAWFLEITGLTQMTGARLSDAIERKSGHVVVLDRQAGPAMRALPVVRASDLTRRQREAALGRFYEWFEDEDLPGVTHGGDIEYYLQALDRNDPAVLSRLFLVWSTEGIEGYEDLGSEGRDFSGIEIAPWNRRGLGEEARYSGLGAELRMFAIRRLESEWGAEVLYGPKINHVITLGHRDSGGDVFDYKTVDLKAVRAEMARQVQVRKRLIREHGFAPAGARLADGHENVYYAVNLTDLGVEFDGRNVVSRRGLDKLLRMLPKLREAGFRRVYLYGGLYQPSPLSVKVHQVPDDGEHYLESARATVRVSGYRTRRDDADGVLLKDSFGNPFSIQGMHRLNRDLSLGRTHEAFERLRSEAQRLGISLATDYIIWTSPDAIDDQSYRRYFWRPVGSEGEGRFGRRGEADKRRSIRRLLGSDTSRSFVLRVGRGDAERPVFVKHLAFFGSHSADQAMPNALHPEVQAELIDSFKRLIDLGLREFRVDLGHLILKKHLRGYYDGLAADGVDLRTWLVDSGIPVRADESFEAWWQRQEEPWRTVIASARAYAYEKHQEPIRVYMETYDPADQQELLFLGADATYQGELFDAFYRVVKQGEPAYLLGEALMRVFAQRSKIITYLTNFDQISLRGIGDAPEAAALLVAILSRWGVRVLHDSRDHAYLRGQISTIPGGSHDPHDKHTHSRGDRQELEARRDLDRYLASLTTEGPLARVLADIERAVPGRSETYATLLNNSNKDRYLAPAWRDERGRWTVVLMDFRPTQKKTFVKLELPSQAATGLDPERIRAVDALSGRIYEITAWEPDRRDSPATVDVRFEPSESGARYRILRLESTDGARLAAEKSGGRAQVDPELLSHMNPDPYLLEAVDHLNERLSGRAIGWEDIMDLYELLRGDRRNPEYTGAIRERRLRSIRTILPERRAIEDLLAVRTSDSTRVIESAVRLYRTIANNEIFTYAKRYRFADPTALPADTRVGLPGFDVVRPLSGGPRAHPADGHHRLAWLAMNHLLIVNGHLPFYFKPGEYDEVYEGEGARMEALGLNLAELAFDGRIRRAASYEPFGQSSAARLAASSAALGRTPEDDRFAELYDAFTSRYETAEGVPVRWATALGDIEARVRYDALFDVFVVRPTDATRKRFSQLDILDLSAAQDDIGEAGSFGNIRIKLREVGGRVVALVDEVHPSRGYRKLGPSSVRRAFRPWSTLAIAALAEDLRGSLGIGAMYASTPERIDQRYRAQAVPQANLWENYRYPFAHRGWTTVRVDLPGETGAVLWYRELAGARLADSDAILERLQSATAIDERLRLGWGMGWDTRPTEARLLDTLYVGHDMEVKKIINPDDRPLVAVYGGSGSDVSNFLLSTNATEAYFVDQIGLTPDGWELAIRDLDTLIGSFYWTDYRASKYTHGHAVTGRDGVENPELSILMELSSIGVDLERIQDFAYTGAGTYTLSFPWRYPGSRERTYRIHFVAADITDPSTYPPVLKQALANGIDLYYQRAGMRIPARYDDFLYAVAGAVKPGGHLVTDDVLFNGYGYKFIDATSRLAPLGFRVGPDLYPPSLLAVTRAIVEARSRVLRAHVFDKPFEPHYGFDVMIRRRDRTAPSRPSGARLSEYAGPLSAPKVAEIVRYGFNTTLNEDDPARVTALSEIERRIAPLESERPELGSALERARSTVWEVFPLTVSSVEHVTQRGGATDLLAIYEREGREGRRLGVAEEVLRGLSPALAAELILRQLLPEAEAGSWARLFPEHYAVRAGRGQLRESVEMLARRRVVPMGVEALLKRLEDFETGIEKGTLKIDDKFPALVSSIAGDVGSLATTSRYLREAVAQPFQKKVRGKRGGPEMSDVYAALRDIGVFEAVVRDELRAMRRELFDADFVSLARRYQRLPLYMRMQQGERDDSPDLYGPEVLREMEAYNAETQELLDGLNGHLPWLEERLRSAIIALPNLSAQQLRLAASDGTPATIQGLVRAGTVLEEMRDFRRTLEPVAGIDGYREFIAVLDAAITRSEDLERTVRDRVAEKMGARLAFTRRIVTPFAPEQIAALEDGTRLTRADSPLLPEDEKGIEPRPDDPRYIRTLDGRAYRRMSLDWPIKTSPLSEVEDDLAPVLGPPGLIGRILEIARRRQADGDRRPVTVVDWGFGSRATALRQLARDLPVRAAAEGLNVRFRFIGFADTYFTDWSAIPTSIEIIFDDAEGFFEHFDPGSIDVLYSYNALGHVYDRKAPGYFTDYLRRLLPLVSTDGFITHNTLRPLANDYPAADLSAEAAVRHVFIGNTSGYDRVALLRPGSRGERAESLREDFDREYALLERSFDRLRANASLDPVVHQKLQRWSERLQGLRERADRQEWGEIHWSLGQVRQETAADPRTAALGADVERLLEAITAWPSVDPSGARLASARQVLYRHNDGVAITSTVAALMDLGVFERLADGSRSLGELAAEIERSKGRVNRGYLHVAFRILAAEGWVRRIGKPGTDTMRFELTPAGQLALKYLPAYRRAAEFLGIARRLDRVLFARSGVAEPDDERLYIELVELSSRQWDLPPAENAADQIIREEVMGHLDGVLVAPTMIELRTRDLAGTDLSLADLEGNRSALEAAYHLLEGQGFAARTNESITWTPVGQMIAQTAWSYGVPVSYMPLFARTPELLTGDPQAVFARDARGHETWVDRPLNVRGSAGAHQSYFASIDRMIGELFNDPDLDAQPKGIADMGSGNGALLKHLYEVVKTQTLRGRHLDTHPLLIIGADLNAEAREATHATLQEAGIPHQVVYGDINQPERFAADLKSQSGVEASDLLHVRSFIDHNRPYAVPRDVDAASRRQSRSSGAFVQLGRVIPNEELEQNLVEHLRGWTPLVSKHGLIVLELHTLDPERTAQNRGRTLDLAYFATHGYSDQYLVEPEIFMAAAEEAGLAAGAVKQGRYPSGPLATVTIDYLKGSVAAEGRPVPPVVSGARLGWKRLVESFRGFGEQFRYYRALAYFAFTSRPGDSLRLRHVGYSPFNDDIGNLILFAGRSSRYAVGISRTDETSYELVRLRQDEDVLTTRFSEGYELISEVHPEIFLEPYWSRYMQGESQIRRLDKFILLDDSKRYTTRYHEVFPVPIDRVRQRVTALGDAVSRTPAPDPKILADLERSRQQVELYERAEANLRALLDDRRVLTEEEAARIRRDLIVLGVYTETQLIMPTLSVDYQFGLVRKSPARPLVYIPIRYYSRLDNAAASQRWFAARVLLYALDHYELRQAHRAAGRTPESIHRRLREFDRQWRGTVPWRIRVAFIFRHLAVYLGDVITMARQRRALRSEIRVFLKDLDALRIPELRPKGLSQTALIRERERSVDHFVQHDYDMRVRIVDLEKRADELAGRARALGAPHLAIQVHRSANRLQQELGVVDSGLIVMDRYVNFLKTLIRHGQFNEFTKALFDLKRGLLPLARGYKVALEPSEKSLFLTLAGSHQFREWMIEMFDRQRIMNRFANQRTVVLAEAEAVRLYDEVVYNFENARGSASGGGAGARLAAPDPAAGARLLRARDYFSEQADRLLRQLDEAPASESVDPGRLERARGQLRGLTVALDRMETAVASEDTTAAFAAIWQAWAVAVRLRAPDWDTLLEGFGEPAERFWRELALFIEAYARTGLDEDRRSALLAVLAAADAHHSAALVRYYLATNPELDGVQDRLREVLERYRGLLGRLYGSRPLGAENQGDIRWIGGQIRETAAEVRALDRLGRPVRERISAAMEASAIRLDQLEDIRRVPPQVVGARLAALDPARVEKGLREIFETEVRPRLSDTDDILYHLESIEGYVRAVEHLNGLAGRRLTPAEFEREWLVMHRLVELGHYSSGRYADWDRKGLAAAHLRAVLSEPFEQLKREDPYRAAARAFVPVVDGQFFGNGNHRLGSLLLNHVLLSSGQEPFYLELTNYRAYRELTTSAAVDETRLAAFLRDSAGARLAAPEDSDRALADALEDLRELRGFLSLNLDRDVIVEGPDLRSSVLRPAEVLRRLDQVIAAITDRREAAHETVLATVDLLNELIYALRPLPGTTAIRSEIVSSARSLSALLREGDEPAVPRSLLSDVAERLAALENLHEALRQAVEIEDPSGEGEASRLMLSLTTTVQHLRWASGDPLGRLRPILRSGLRSTSSALHPELTVMYGPGTLEALRRIDVLLRGVSAELEPWIERFGDVTAEDLRHARQALNKLQISRDMVARLSLELDGSQERELNGLMLGLGLAVRRIGGLREYAAGLYRDRDRVERLVQHIADRLRAHPAAGNIPYDVRALLVGETGDSLRSVVDDLERVAFGDSGARLAGSEERAEQTRGRIREALERYERRYTDEPGSRVYPVTNRELFAASGVGHETFFRYVTPGSDLEAIVMRIRELAETHRAGTEALRADEGPKVSAVLTALRAVLETARTAPQELPDELTNRWFHERTGVAKQTFRHITRSGTTAADLVRQIRELHRAHRDERFAARSRQELRDQRADVRTALEELAAANADPSGRARVLDIEAVATASGYDRHLTGRLVRGSASLRRLYERYRTDRYDAAVLNAVRDLSAVNRRALAGENDYTEFTVDSLAASAGVDGATVRSRLRNNELVRSEFFGALPQLAGGPQGSVEAPGPDATTLGTVRPFELSDTEARLLNAARAQWTAQLGAETPRTVTAETVALAAGMKEKTGFGRYRRIGPYFRALSDRYLLAPRTVNVLRGLGSLLRTSPTRTERSGGDWFVRTVAARSGVTVATARTELQRPSLEAHATAVRRAIESVAPRLELSEALASGLIDASHQEELVRLLSAYHGNTEIVARLVDARLGWRDLLVIRDYPIVRAYLETHRDRNERYWLEQLQDTADLIPLFEAAAEGGRVEFTDLYNAAYDRGERPFPVDLSIVSLWTAKVPELSPYDHSGAAGAGRAPLAIGAATEEAEEEAGAPGARLAQGPEAPQLVVGVRTVEERGVVLEALGGARARTARVFLVPRDLTASEQLALLDGAAAPLALLYDGPEDLNRDAKIDLLRQLAPYIDRADQEAYPLLAGLLSGERELSGLSSSERAEIERTLFALLPVIRPVSIEDRLREGEEALLELRLRLFHPSFGYTLEHLESWTEPRAAVWSLETVVADPFFFRMLDDRDRKVRGRLPIVDYVVVPEGVDAEALLGERTPDFETRFAPVRRLRTDGTARSALSAVSSAALAEFGTAFARERTLLVQTREEPVSSEASPSLEEMPSLIVRGRIAPILDKVVVEILDRAGSDRPLIIRGLTRIGDLYIYVPVVPIDFTKHFRRYYQMVRQIGAAA